MGRHTSWSMSCDVWTTLIARGALQFRVVIFKQKTAYDRRISDWSSDVCSSDLMQNLRATRVPIEPSLDGRNLAGDPFDAGQEVALLFDHMSQDRKGVV